MDHSLSARMYKILLNTSVVLFSICVLYPFIYVIAYSLSDSTAAMTQNIVLLPVSFTLRNYSEVFSERMIYTATMVSVFRTVVGAVWTAAVTSLAGYAISKKDLPGSKFFSMFLIVPMYVSGGLIPFYVLIHDLHLFNNLLVYILPGGFYAFNMLIIKAYFDTIPPSLEESAKIDGAGYWRIYIRIILPLSMPVVAVILMLTAVSQWNSWFDAVLFMTKQHLFPLQKVLQDMLQNSQITVQALQSGQAGSIQRAISPESVRMATLVVTTVPIIIVYPFFQKHFTKGIMIGAVKA